MRFINPLGNIAYERVVYDGDSSDGKRLVGISSLSWRMLKWMSWCVEELSYSVNIGK